MFDSLSRGDALNRLECHVGENNSPSHLSPPPGLQWGKFGEIFLIAT